MGTDLAALMQAFPEWTFSESRPPGMWVAAHREHMEHDEHVLAETVLGLRILLERISRGQTPL